MGESRRNKIQHVSNSQKHITINDIMFAKIVSVNQYVSFHPDVNVELLNHHKYYYSTSICRSFPNFMESLDRLSDFRCVLKTLHSILQCQLYTLWPWKLITDTFLAFLLVGH